MEQIRRCIFRPYRPGCGPVFALTVWDTGRTDWRGQSVLAYRLTAAKRTIFQGEDFSGSPLNADDSDATVAALMGFLTLRPGDTDTDYFHKYTEDQLVFCDQHAEALSAEVLNRFGEGCDALLFEAPGGAERGGHGDASA